MAADQEQAADRRAEHDAEVDATRTDAYAASCRSGGTRSATIAWSAPPPIEPPMPARRDEPETEPDVVADEA